jgi:hypothetical protein
MKEGDHLVMIFEPESYVQWQHKGVTWTGTTSERVDTEGEVMTMVNPIHPVRMGGGWIAAERLMPAAGLFPYAVDRHGNQLTQFVR